MTAEILAYSRSRGLFAGVSLQGATLRQDLNANEAMYQKPLTTKQIVRDGAVKPTPAAQKLLATLATYAPVTATR